MLFQGVALSERLATLRAAVGSIARVSADVPVQVVCMGN